MGGEGKSYYDPDDNRYGIRPKCAPDMILLKLADNNIFLSRIVLSDLLFTFN